MNSFGSRSKLRAGGQEYEIYRLDALEKHDCSAQRLPFSLKILLENLLRTENGRSVTADDVRFLADWKPQATAICVIDILDWVRRARARCSRSRK